MELEIFDYTGAGYDPTMHFDTWRVAFLNYCDDFEREKFCRMERHMLTDEVFVL